MLPRRAQGLPECHSSHHGRILMGIFHRTACTGCSAVNLPPPSRGPMSSFRRAQKVGICFSRGMAITRLERFPKGWFL